MPLPRPFWAFTMATREIRLDQLLKLAGMVGTGGEAKVLIQAGEVQVNGEIEMRRRRKLKPTDVVSLGDTSLVVREVVDQ